MEEASIDDPFTKGTEVEVSNEEEGFRGSWYAAKIIQPMTSTSNKLYLKYHSLMSTRDRSKHLREWVDYILVRPVPPRECSRSFRVMDDVDAFQDDGWWEGVVIEVINGDDDDDNDTKKKKKTMRYSVYFRTSREQLVFEEEELRLHREWVHGKWVPPLDDLID